jgi:energy-coupling factor transporter ATP-binding protein EcfA2
MPASGFKSRQGKYKQSQQQGEIDVTFKKAVKHEAKGRVALIGPAGSGKSFTMLTLARLLAGQEGKIAAVDTEHGSLSKYADLFDFDCDMPSSFEADYWLEKLTEAERAGYAVFCTDSLSHFWMGKGGALEFVDEKTRAGGRGDSFSGWKAFRPRERMMVDRMLASPCHILCTMRTQTEYVEETDERGKKRRRKIGLKPVQRDGLEYEFDLVGCMDEDNTLIIDKSRVILSNGKAPYTGKAIAKPSAKDFEAFASWLHGAPAPAPKPTPPQTNGTPPPRQEPTKPAAAATNGLHKPEEKNLNASIQPPSNDGNIDPPKTITPQQAKEIGHALTNTGITWEWLLSHFKVARAGELTVLQFDEILGTMSRLQKQYVADMAKAEEIEIPL